MSDNIGGDNIHIRLTCPHCRKQFQKTAAWINAHDYARCDFCREPMGLNAHKRQTAAAELLDKVRVAKSPRRKR